jgi:hypothetical protein
MEETALGFAPGGALLLNSVALQFVIHDLNCSGQYSGGWERLEVWVFDAYSSGAKALLLSGTCGTTEVVPFYKADGEEF